MVKKVWRCVYSFWQNIRTWQTYGRTDTARRHRPRLCIASRGKNDRTLDLCTSPSGVAPTPSSLRVFSRLCKSLLLSFLHKTFGLSSYVVNLIVIYLTLQLYYSATTLAKHGMTVLSLYPTVRPSVRLSLAIRDSHKFCIAVGYLRPGGDYAIWSVCRSVCLMCAGLLQR